MAKTQEELKQLKELSEGELVFVAGGTEETTYKYVFKRFDSVNAKADGFSKYVIDEDVKTNDGSYDVKCFFDSRGEGFRPSRHPDDDVRYLSTSQLMTLYKQNGGHLSQM